MRPHQQVIGALIHLANTTRPDISYAVSYLARHMTNPTMAAWNTAKGVLRYLKGTKDFGIIYKKTGDEGLYGYSDSDWAQEKPQRKSIGGLQEVKLAGRAKDNRLSRKVLLKQSILRWRTL